MVYELSEGETLNMMVSGISVKDGEKVAYVMFEEGVCKAEGIIPDCKITSHTGFTDEEIRQLEQYMIGNLMMLKKQAASINPIKAMMDEKIL